MAVRGGSARGLTRLQRARRVAGGGGPVAAAADLQAARREPPGAAVRPLPRARSPGPCAPCPAPCLGPSLPAAPGPTRNPAPAPLPPAPRPPSPPLPSMCTPTVAGICLHGFNAVSNCSDISVSLPNVREAIAAQGSSTTARTGKSLVDVIPASMAPQTPEQKAAAAAAAAARPAQPAARVRPSVPAQAEAAIAGEAKAEAGPKQQDAALKETEKKPLGRRLLQLAEALFAPSVEIEAERFRPLVVLPKPIVSMNVPEFATAVDLPPLPRRNTPIVVLPQVRSVGGGEGRAAWRVGCEGRPLSSRAAPCNPAVQPPDRAPPPHPTPTPNPQPALSFIPPDINVKLPPFDLPRRDIIVPVLPKPPVRRPASFPHRRAPVSRAPPLLPGSSSPLRHLETPPGPPPPPRPVPPPPPAPQVSFYPPDFQTSIGGLTLKQKVAVIDASRTGPRTTFDIKVPPVINIPNLTPVKVRRGAGCREARSRRGQGGAGSWESPGGSRDKLPGTP
jgi:hypothetical protein